MRDRADNQEQISKQNITIQALQQQFERLNSDSNLLNTKSLTIIGVWLTAIGLVFPSIKTLSWATQDIRLSVILIVAGIVIIFTIFALMKNSILATNFADPPGMVTVKKEIRDKHTEAEFNELIINDYLSAYDQNSYHLNKAYKNFNNSVIFGTISVLIMLYLLIGG